MTKKRKLELYNLLKDYMHKIEVLEGCDDMHPIVNVITGAHVDYARMSEIIYLSERKLVRPHVITEYFIDKARFTAPQEDAEYTEK